MKSPDLHGQAPDQSSTALLIVDVINDLEFVGGEDLLLHAVPMAKRIALLKRQVKSVGIPVIYANDNFGKWRSDFTRLVRHVHDNTRRGWPLVALLEPEEDDYCILKPKHSGFFHTTLDLLVKYLQVTTLIITGIQTHICVLFTANDAYLRDLELIIPSDCVAAEQREDHEYALRLMRQVLKADLRPSTDLSMETLLQAGRTPSATAPSR